jgi:hypothetical protein
LKEARPLKPIRLQKKDFDLVHHILIQFSQFSACYTGWSFSLFLFFLFDAWFLFTYSLLAFQNKQFFLENGFVYVYWLFISVFWSILKWIRSRPLLCSTIIPI